MRTRSSNHARLLVSIDGELCGGADVRTGMRNHLPMPVLTICRTIGTPSRHVHWSCMNVVLYSRQSVSGPMPSAALLLFAQCKSIGTPDHSLLATSCVDANSSLLFVWLSTRCTVCHWHAHASARTMADRSLARRSHGTVSTSIVLTVRCCCLAGSAVLLLLSLAVLTRRGAPSEPKPCDIMVTSVLSVLWACVACVCRLAESYYVHNHVVHGALHGPTKPSPTTIRIACTDLGASRYREVASQHRSLQVIACIIKQIRMC